jgi:hypothetical protein
MAVSESPFQTLRRLILIFFLGFPIIISNLMGFLALGLGNLGLLVLFLGHAVVIPFLLPVVHLFTAPLPSVVGSDVGMLVPSDLHPPSFNVTPSYWITHVTFFFSYLFTNALDVYRQEPVSDTPQEEWRVENRRSRASMIMSMCVFLCLFMVAARYMITKTETMLGTLVGLGGAGALGWAWYSMASLMGSRKSDVFGIVQQMIPIQEDDTNATMCLQKS